MSKLHNFFGVTSNPGEDGGDRPSRNDYGYQLLEKIDIDYAPAEGKYSTFRNGAPVAVRLSLGFREVEIAHKKRIYQGF